MHQFYEHLICLSVLSTFVNKEKQENQTILSPSPNPTPHVAAQIAIEKAEWFYTEQYLQAK